jgi:hypothetical protein
MDAVLHHPRLGDQGFQQVTLGWGRPKQGLRTETGTDSQSRKGSAQQQRMTPQPPQEGIALRACHPSGQGDDTGETSQGCVPGSGRWRICGWSVPFHSRWPDPKRRIMPEGRASQTTPPGRSEHCHPTTRSRCSCSHHHGATRAWAEPVTGSSGIPRPGAKNRSL